MQFIDFLSLAYAELYSILECMLSRPVFALIERDTEPAYDGFGPLSLQESGFDTVHGVSNTGESHRRARLVKIYYNCYYL